MVDLGLGNTSANIVKVQAKENAAVHSQFIFSGLVINYHLVGGFL